ncbi:hypothetical protein SAMN04488550_0372 [Gordonia malaquae]|uniref:Uncharacterized protein n=1 Tax=Gordonia malaquae NBRC 108250 TaxID=1223542 RepID=M3TBU2_GORML|nr:hypothetical protein [Gordonia malaquae]GAC78861.1 hypothetical protein GM1_005_00440 [Gordonia malaquae NBRC 108250]SEB56717.1 hypothetical protein SAMN04488550_0372 [Gordonia malaquae]
MSGGRCWSSIVATSDERAALSLGPDAEWLIGCVLYEGHPGAHASDGDQPHHGRRRWLVWGDFARGAQMLRDEDPCPMAGVDGSPCRFYRGHSGPHSVAAPAAPPVMEAPRVDPASPMDRRPAAAAAYVPPSRPSFPPTAPWPAPSAFDMDPDPPTETFAPLPTPPGWPHVVDSRTAMDRLFADLPSLRPEDAPFVPPSPDGTWRTFGDAPPTPVAAIPTDPVPAEPAEVDVVDVEVVDVDEVDVVDPPSGPVDDVPPIEVPDGAVAVHPEPVIITSEESVTSGPAKFVPADDRSGKRQKHKRKKVDNTYEPSLGDDAPGGATTVVFRDDPDATLMEVRPTSDAVLTTSILQVIASNDDPLRMGVPTTLRRAATATPELTGADLKAMTAAVRGAADRLRDEAAADDARELREALRDVAGTIAEIASRLPE